MAAYIALEKLMYSAIGKYNTLVPILGLCNIPVFVLWTVSMLIKTQSELLHWFIIFCKLGTDLCDRRRKSTASCVIMVNSTVRENCSIVFLSGAAWFLSYWICRSCQDWWQVCNPNREYLNCEKSSYEIQCIIFVGICLMYMTITHCFFWHNYWKYVKRH
jgi:hypothetical protein